MKNKIEFEYQDKYIKSIASHFANVSEEFMLEELEDFDTIHPKGNENIKDIISNGVGFDIEQLSSHYLEGNGGVYCISIPKVKTVYIGESINLEKRLVQHYEELVKGTHSNTKLLKAFQKNGGKATITLLEQGEVTEYNKAEFKVYCLKRENYYKELFHNNGYGLFNVEDTLHAFYLSFDSLFKFYPFFKIKRQRAHSMQDLKLMAESGESKEPACVKRERERYSWILKALQNR